MSKRQEEDSQRDNIVIRSELAETKVCKKEIRGVTKLSAPAKFVTFPPHFPVPLLSTLALLVVSGKDYRHSSERNLRTQLVSHPL